MSNQNTENNNTENPSKTSHDFDKNSRGEISKSASKKKTNISFWPKIALALVLIIGLVVLFKNILPDDDSRPRTASAKTKSEDGSSLFMKYEGPLLPIMMSPENQIPDIEADRKLIYDFFPIYNKRPMVQTAFLKDQYFIENKGQEKQIRLLYPFVSSIDNLYYSCPTIMQDGELSSAKLHYGNYTGDFVSTKNEIDPSETLNLRDYSSWKEYQRLLNDKKYIEEGFSPAIDGKNIPLILYSFSNSYYPESSEAENPTLIAKIKIDRNKSKVLTLGFDGFAKFGDSKEEFYQYSMPKKQENSFTDDRHYLMIVGEDTSTIDIETQSTGGWDAYEKNSPIPRNNLKDAGANLEREEMNLEEALDRALPILYERYKEKEKSLEDQFNSLKLNHHQRPSHLISYEDFKELYMKELFERAALSEKPMMRYDDGSLESLDVTNIQRVIFADFEINLPASKTSKLEISSYKQGSYDFYGDNYDKNIYGYDLLTSLDSSMPIESYKVEVINYDKIAPVKQNFGLDLEENIQTVSLSKEVPHYFMELREKK